MPLEYDSWFGAVEELNDWRKRPADPIPDDDAERPTTPDVIALLGFDPAKKDDDEIEFEHVAKGDYPGHPFRGNQYTGGIPEAITGLHDYRVAAERGAFDIRGQRLPKRGMFGRDDDYEVEFHPRIPEGIEPLDQPGRRREYYDPRLADLETIDEGTVIERKIPRPKAGLATEIEPLSEPDVMYRGLSADEFDVIRQTGQVVSRGDYNIGEAQQGLTYWTLDPRTADSYASGFAPWQYKPLFDRPAYVVASKIPKEVRNVAGTAENEVGVARPIRRDEIIGVWRGDVYAHKPAVKNFRNRSYDPNQPQYESAGGVGGSSNVVWTRADQDVHKAWDESKHPRHPQGISEGGQFAAAGGAGEFVEARAKSSRGGYLSPIDPSGLAGHQLYMNKEGTVGYAIDPDGDLQNLFNNGGPKGAGGKAVVDAIERGGRTLDCYDGFLNDYYRQFGFHETGRMQFNDQFAPSGWNFDRDNRPDVVFMGWKGYDGGPEQSLTRAGNRKSWVNNERSTRYGNDWDEHKQRSRDEANWGKTSRKPKS